MNTPEESNAWWIQEQCVERGPGPGPGLERWYREIVTPDVALWLGAQCVADSLSVVTLEDAWDARGSDVY